MLSMKEIDDFQDVEMHVSMLWILIDCKNRPNINNKHVNLNLFMKQQFIMRAVLVTMCLHKYYKKNSTAEPSRVLTT